MKHRILTAMLSMTGRITMLGLSRWAGPGVSATLVRARYPSDTGSLTLSACCERHNDIVLRVLVACKWSVTVWAVWRSV
jgi:hypothetical protein